MPDEHETRHFLCCEHLDQFLTDPRHVHLIVANYIMRYLKGTVDYGLKYEANQNINLEGYVDSDWAGSAIDRKSALGCCLSMGSGVISWFSRKQSTEYSRSRVCCSLFG